MTNIDEFKESIKKSRLKKTEDEVSLYDVCKLYSLLDVYLQELKSKYEKECFEKLKKSQPSLTKIELNSYSAIHDAVNPMHMFTSSKSARNNYDIKADYGDKCFIGINYELNDSMFIKEKDAKFYVSYYEADSFYSDVTECTMTYKIDGLPFIDEDKLNRTYDEIDEVFKEKVKNYFRTLEVINELKGNIETKSSNTEVFINNKDGYINIKNSDKEDFNLDISHMPDGTYREDYSTKNNLSFKGDNTYDEIFKRIYLTYDKLPKWMISYLKDGYDKKYAFEKLSEYINNKIKM